MKLAEVSFHRLAYVLLFIFMDEPETEFTTGELAQLVYDHFDHSDKPNEHQAKRFKQRIRNQLKLMRQSALIVRLKDESPLRKNIIYKYKLLNGREK